MIKIGCDDEEESRDYLDESDAQIDKEEREKLLMSAKEKYNSIKIPERRINEIMDKYDCVVVQDFGDDYHLSEEEREKTNQFYKIFKKYSKAKKSKYRKLDKYVEIMREALEVLDAVAEKNGEYEPEKFKKLFLKGKIKINGLYLPQYAGPNKKHLDPEFLAEFILSDKDPEEILPKPKNELISEEDYEKCEQEVFADQNIEEFIHPQMEHDYYVDPLFDEELDNAAEFAQPMGKKEIKKLIKASPELLYTLKDIKRNSRNLRNLGKFVYDFTMDDLEYIEAYDKEHNYNDNGFEPPEFTGDIMNPDDYHRYLTMLDEWEQANVFDDYKGNIRSLEKINTLETLALFEESGFNVMKFYGQEEKAKKREKLIKQDEKRSKKIKKRLMNIEARKERNRKISDNLKPVKRKKKKKGKEFKEIKKAQMDDILLSASEMGSYKEYKADALDWSFGGEE